MTDGCVIALRARTALEREREVSALNALSLVVFNLSRVIDFRLTVTL